MRTAPSAVLAALLAAVAAVPAQAHHEVGGYDVDHPVVVDGVVREFLWANPHVMLYLEVPNASAGKDEWALEVAAVPVLARHGWTRRSLRPGDRVQVLLAPKRDAERSGRILRVTQSDGHVLSIGAPPAAR